MSDERRHVQEAKFSRDALAERFPSRDEKALRCRVAAKLGGHNATATMIGAETSA
jgi:hypothetical protein